MNGNSNDTSGTYNGTPTDITYQGGAFDQAAVFNGSSSYIDTNGNPLKTGAFSVSFWTKLNAYGTSPAFVSTANNSGSQGFEIRQNSSNNKLDFYFGAGSVFTDSNSALPLNEWMHIACTYDSTTLKIYINGVQQTSTATGTLASVNNNIYIGKAYNYSRYINGSIDQVRIFNTALTQAQVTTLARGIATSYSGASTDVNFNGQLDFAPGLTPGLTWIKARDAAHDHLLVDSVNGAGSAKGLVSNATYYEGQYTATYGYISSLNSNGFTVVAGSSYANYTNVNNEDYVSWNWKAGGTAVTNNDGTIPSQVSANKDSGFSVVTYTGASGTVGHGLNSTPQIIIQKQTNGTLPWYTYVPPGIIDSTSNYYYLELNTTAAKGTTGATPPTSTTFNPASNSGNFVAYCWHSVAGYSEIGVYEGNTTTLPSITLGFAPAFILFKRTDVGDRWLIADTKRADRLTDMDDFLDPQDSAAEGTFGATNGINFLNNGFSINTTDGVLNATGGTYLYMAIA